jgi:hypothetical protein
MCEIPERAYKFMELLIRAVEKLELQDIGNIPRSEYRKVKTDSLKRDSFNIIDGDYLEHFLHLDNKSQNSVISAVLLNQREFNPQILKDCKALIEIMRDKH